MKKMTTVEKIKAALARHPDWDDKRIQNASGGKRAWVQVLRADPNAIILSQSGTIDHIVTTAQEHPNGLVSLSKIVSKYDIRSAILREIELLPEGELIPEAILCERTAGKDRNRFRRTVENCADEFKSLRVKARLDDSSEGKWLWGRKDDVEAARKIIES